MSFEKRPVDDAERNRLRLCALEIIRKVSVLERLEGKHLLQTLDTASFEELSGGQLAKHHTEVNRCLQYGQGLVGSLATSEGPVPIILSEWLGADFDNPAKHMWLIAQQHDLDNKALVSFYPDELHRDVTKNIDGTI